MSVASWVCFGSVGASDSESGLWVTADGVGGSLGAWVTTEVAGLVRVGGEYASRSDLLGDVTGLGVFGCSLVGGDGR